MSSIREVATDVTSSITSLAAGIAGVASDRASSFLLAQLAPTTGNSVGHLGMIFVVQAATASVAFAALDYVAPEITANVFSNILFFNANRGLMSSSIGLSQRLVPMIPLSAPPKATGKSSCCQ